MRLQEAEAGLAEFSKKLASIKVRKSSKVPSCFKLLCSFHFNFVKDQIDQREDAAMSYDSYKNKLAHASDKTEADIQKRQLVSLMSFASF